MDNETLLFDRLEMIKTTINKYGEENFYISFSGGKDSTVLHHLVDMALPGNKIPRVFSNTGIEYEHIVKFVKEMAEQDNRFITIYPHKNIKKTLEYFFEIKGNSIEDCHGGIGIVEYAYKDAYNYYLNIWKIQKQNENLNIKSFIPKDVSVTILPPQPKKKKKKLFAFLDEEVN